MKTLQEKAQNIRIIFFDIDDTLRAKTTGYIPESVALAFKKLKKRGILTGIATGRNLYGVVPDIKALKADYYVTINGAYVEKADGTLIYSHPFETSLVEEVVSWLKSEQSNYSFVGSHELTISRWDSAAKEAIEIIYGVLIEDKEYYKTHDVYQMLTVSFHDKDLRLPPELKKKIRLVRWHDFSSDVVPISGSKADGVQYVLDKLGLNPSNLMNFGDGLNDHELFDLAGLSVAMKKSHPEILEKADFVTDTIENDGIYKALIELGIIDK